MNQLLSKNYKCLEKQVIFYFIIKCKKLLNEKEVCGSGVKGTNQECNCGTDKVLNNF